MKPIPSVYRRHVQSTPDDEMFLDQEAQDGDNEVSNQGFPLKSPKFVAHHKHVVYRRNPDTDGSAGDYGKASGRPDPLELALYTGRTRSRTISPFGNTVVSVKIS